VSRVARNASVADTVGPSPDVTTRVIVCARASAQRAAFGTGQHVGRKGTDDDTLPGTLLEAMRRVKEGTVVAGVGAQAEGEP